MSAKDTAASLTGIVLSKARGKTTVPEILTPINNDLKDIESLRIVVLTQQAALQKLMDRVHIAEQKINNMQVDPGTKVVSFPDT